MKSHIQESFDRDVADKIRGYPRPETFPIEFEWAPENPKRLPKERCWNSHFWYDNSDHATEKSVIIRKSDFDKLLKDARKAAP